MTGWIIASLGGTAGITLLVLRAMLGGTISHVWKRYLGRKSDGR